MPEKTDKCSNPACHCPAGMDREYCSDYCENAHREVEPEFDCRCGHPECQPVMPVVD